jgi:hypothetical protein
MNELKIKDPEKNGHYLMLEEDDFEYQNPIEKMSETVIRMMSKMFQDYLMFAKENNKLPDAKGVGNPDLILERIALRNAKKMWQEKLQTIMRQNLPEGIFSILKSTSKKEQIKLLKGLSLTTEQLMLFIFKAWEDFGFTYSMYSSYHNHTGLDESKMPKFSYKKDNGEIKSIGETSLTKGQIKNAMDQRTVIISRFIDNGEFWHCFFLTFKSLKGEENYKDGQPHLHFISHTWGLSREYVLQQLKSKEYKLPSLPHIDFYTHRNPR